MRTLVVCVVLSALLCLSVSATRVDNCPSVANENILVNCDALTVNEDCNGRCCRSKGHCKDSSCGQVFGKPNQGTCSGECNVQVNCIPDKQNCDASGIVHCLGHVECEPGTACFGYTAGERCLYNGNSNNFKVCSPVVYVPPDDGFIVGDPQFVGLRGQSYQVHGVSGEIYNIVSDADLQYNSRFVFLDKGECPVIKGKKQKGCFAHPGSYLGELGLKTSNGDKIHISTGRARDGFTLVEVNSQPMDVGDVVTLEGGLGFVSLNSTHLATVSIGRWLFDFENSDMFVNQRVRVLDVAGLRSHGMLGQTWREITYPTSLKYIQGTVDDYVIRNGDIFGDDFVYNTFN
jgi:hypothetical protein